MFAGFTPQVEVFLVLSALALFGTAAYFTRATPRRNAAALVATLVFSILNVLWDIAAYKATWWWYVVGNRMFAPLALYLAQDLVWGGALALVGWRIQRRLGALGLAIFVALLSVIGGIRDSVEASVTRLLVFGPSPLARFMDVVCWATLLSVAQLTMRLVAGPATQDALTRKAERSGRD